MKTGKVGFTDMEADINEYNTLRLISNCLNQIKTDLYSMKLDPSICKYEFYKPEAMKHLSEYLTNIDSIMQLNSFYNQGNEAQILFVDSESVNEAIKQKNESLDITKMVHIELVGLLEKELRLIIDKAYSKYNEIYEDRVLDQRQSLDNLEVMITDVLILFNTIIDLLRDNIDLCESLTSSIYSQLKAEESNIIKTLNEYSIKLSRLLSTLLADPFKTELLSILAHEKEIVSALEKDINVIEKRLQVYDDQSEEYNLLLKDFRKYTNLISLETDE